MSVDDAFVTAEEALTDLVDALKYDQVRVWDAGHLDTIKPRVR
jgi:hypothetical protein